MTDKELQEKCSSIGDVIPKLSKLYDGLETLDVIDKVDEISANYDNIMVGESEHAILIHFNKLPFHDIITEVTEKLNSLVGENGATLEDIFLRSPVLDDDSNLMNYKFELKFKWR